MTPGFPSLVFLAYLFIVMPLSAIRSARVLRASRDAGRGDGGAAPGKPAAPPPTRERIWSGTIVSLVLQFVLAWMVGRTWDYEMFRSPAAPLGQTIGAAVAALAACFALRAIVRWVRAAEIRKGIAVHDLAPRTPRERALAFVAILCAGVAEEAAYRGVAMSILWFWLGNGWIAAILCAIGFALAHFVQGWKTGLAIFGMALVMHGLVEYTGSLIPAMIVHVIYDLVAGHLIRNEALRLDAERA